MTIMLDVIMTIICIHCHSSMCSICDLRVRVSIQSLHEIHIAVDLILSLIKLNYYVFSIFIFSYYTVFILPVLVFILCWTPYFLISAWWWFDR